MSHNPVVEAVIYSIDLQKEQTIFGYFMQNFVDLSAEGYNYVWEIWSPCWEKSRRRIAIPAADSIYFLNGSFD